MDATAWIIAIGAVVALVVLGGLMLWIFSKSFHNQREDERRAQEQEARDEHHERDLYP